MSEDDVLVAFRHDLEALRVAYDGKIEAIESMSYGCPLPMRETFTICVRRDDAERAKGEIAEECAERTTTTWMDDMAPSEQVMRRRRVLALARELLVNDTTYRTLDQYVIRAEEWIRSEDAYVLPEDMR